MIQKQSRDEKFYEKAMMMIVREKQKNLHEAAECKEKKIVCLHFEFIQHGS